MQPLLLGVLLDPAVGLHGLDLLEALNRFLDRLEIGQQSPEPTLIDVELIAAKRLLLDCVLGLTLRSDEEHGLVGPFTGHVLEELHRLFEHPLGFLQIDDVYAVAFPEDKLLHFRVPTTNLMPEMDSRFEQFLHCNSCQTDLRCFGLMYSPSSPYRTNRRNNQRSGEERILRRIYVNCDL